MNESINFYCPTWAIFCNIPVDRVWNKCSASGILASYARQGQGNAVLFLTFRGLIFDSLGPTQPQGATRHSEQTAYCAIAQISKPCHNTRTPY